MTRLAGTPSWTHGAAAGYVPIVAEQDWQELLRQAAQLSRSGRVDEAIAAYKRLLAIKPNLADSWYDLAWLQRQARAFDQSLSSYQRALDLNVRDPEEVHVNRGVIYADHLHRPEDALGALSAALEKNPDYVPALLNLGNLHEDLGNRAKARAAYEKILAIEPKHSLALARLAGISHSAELDAGLATRLRSAIARSDCSAAEKADLGFALAGLLDASGCYDDAFETASAANLASSVVTRVSYDRTAHERFVDRLIATFDRPVRAYDSGEIPSVFVCGLFRSGSTLTEQILASHSRVTSGGELDLIPALVDRIADYPASVPAADPETVAGWRAFYLKGLPVMPRQERLITDKRPDNFLHIGLIKTIFPDAKIIHTRRNPLDNLLSLYFLHLDPGMAYALDIQDAAHWYRNYQRLMAHWEALYPGDIFDVDYDALVRDPQPIIEQLLNFCRLGWEDEILNFAAHRSAVKTASVWQVRQPLHARSSGRWRNYRTQLERIVQLFPEASRD